MLRIALAVVAGLLLLVPSGQAAVVTLGSDLTKPANHFEAHGADSAFWMEQVGGKPAAMPVNGEVTFVRIKGSVIDDPPNPPFPDPQFHIQVVHPNSAGAVTPTRTSRPFRLPVTTSESQAITGYQPVNLCVGKGDFVDFNDIGGFEWRYGGADGMRVNVFSDPAAGATTRFYSKNAGTNNGQTFNDPTAPQATYQARELLMQVRVATGPDATDLCLGGYRQHVFKGLELRNQPAPLDNADRTVTVRGACGFATYGSCRGTLALTATLAGKATKLGTVPFRAARGASARVDLKLSDTNAKAIRKARRVAATAVATAHDDPASDTRASTNKPPVQNATTTAKVVIQSDVPPVAKKPSKKKDKDGDGLPDKWEKAHGTNPKKSDATKDPDDDDLRNADELGWQTEPKKADTDGDKFADGGEIEDGTNPTDRKSFKPPDTDADGLPDATDNCPTKPNSDQADNDKDKKGDLCETDDDNDGRADQSDNCPTVANAGQQNSDPDGLGDACDLDDDADGAPDTEDSCPLDSDPVQFNNEGTAPADACDPDDDDDAKLDTSDNCPLAANAGQENSDSGSDGGDACDTDDDNDAKLDTSDNCRTVQNADQANNDGDAEGDVCDADDDNDGAPDAGDNCAFTSNGNQANHDSDPLGDACDADDDGDDVSDGLDNCPVDANADQTNSDNDGLGDACDPDDDNDGFADEATSAAGADNCRTVANPSQADGDLDGVGDACDNCPADPSADRTDTDGDGEGNPCDLDDDNDGSADLVEIAALTDPLDPNDHP